jgi:hypothetical protein
MITNFTRLATFALLFGVNYSAFCQLNWQTTGNVVTPGQFIGSTNNQPLRIRTNNNQRMHINQSGTTFNGVPTDGYIGIGFNPTDIRSRLTITGTNNTPGFTGGGYRAWMRTGVFCLENSDLFFIFAY